MFDFDMPPLEWRDATIPKKSGGVRHIKIPCPELKEVQRDILMFLYDLYSRHKIQVSSFAHGFVPWRNTCSSIVKHSLQSKVFLCMDMKDFFDNFPMAPVRQAILDAGVSELLTDKILTACSYDGHFPQGSPTSPWLTNIGMFECDLMIAAYAKRSGFAYTRYADDITLSLLPGQEPAPEPPDVQGETEGQKRLKNPYYKIFHGVEAILKSHLGLVLKHKKDHVIWRFSRCKPLILGICIRQDNEGYNASKTLRRNTRAGVHNLYRDIYRKRLLTPEDIAKWKEVLGCVRYMDYIRSFSPSIEASSADPIIQSKEFEYLQKRFSKITGGLV